MPGLAWNSTASLAIPPPSPAFIRSDDVLSTLALGQVAFVYLQRSTQFVQIALKGEADDDEDVEATERLAQLYEEVKGKVTDLIAALLHLETLGQSLPPFCPFSSPSGFVLTCQRKKAGVLVSRWEWSRGNIKLDALDCKLSLTFGEA